MHAAKTCFEPFKGKNLYSRLAKNYQRRKNPPNKPSKISSKALFALEANYKTFLLGIFELRA
jgi:hypothetical protein